MEFEEVQAVPRRVSAQTRTALGVQVSGPVPEGGGGPVGVGRRRVGAGHVHVMHAGQGALPQKNTKSTKRGAQSNRFEQETTEGTESGLKRGHDTDEWAGELNRS